MKTFFVVFLMTGSNLIVYSNFFVSPREDPSPTSSYFSFISLDNCLVIGFLGGIVPATKVKFQRLCKTKKWIKAYELWPTNLLTQILTSKSC
jgi:hypothetical protein